MPAPAPPAAPACPAVRTSCRFPSCWRTPTSGWRRRRGGGCGGEAGARALSQGRQPLQKQRLAALHMGLPARLGIPVGVVGDVFEGAPGDALSLADGGDGEQLHVHHLHPVLEQPGIHRCHKAIAAAAHHPFGAGLELEGAQGEGGLAAGGERLGLHVHLQHAADLHQARQGGVEAAGGAVVHHQLGSPALQLAGEGIGGVELADARVQHAGMVEFLGQGRHDQDRGEVVSFRWDRRQGEAAARPHPCRVAPVVAPRCPTLSAVSCCTWPPTWRSWWRTPATYVTHLFVINNEGKFVRSTNEDPSLIPNMFSFCSKYKNLLTENLGQISTPIIPPMPEPHPFKFITIPSNDRSRLIEVGLRVDFIGQTLSRAIENDSSIEELNLYAHDGTSLGRFSREKFSVNKTKIDLPLSLDKTEERPNYYKIFKKVVSFQGNCCQCSIPGIKRAGDYYYVLELKVSKKSLNSTLDSIDMFFYILILSVTGVGLLLAGYLSRKLVHRFDIVIQSIKRIKKSKLLSDRIESTGSDEINDLALEFNELFETLEKSQEELLQTKNEAALGQMALQVSHDIRSPLEVLKGLKEELHALPDSSRKRIQLSINRIEEVTFNLLKDHKLTIPNLLNDKTEELLGLIKSSLIEKQIQFRSKDNIELLDNCDKNSFGNFSKIDRSKLKSIISNLINNAVEAIGHNSGIVEITLMSLGNNNIIRIKDNGPGISKETSSKLFTKGFTTKKTGNGLGLVNAKQDLEAVGGTLTFESEEGKGTTFIITLPKSDIPSSFIDAIHAYNYERIIVLDDDPSFHDVWAKRLEGLESKIEHINSVEEMFSKYQALHPKILLLSDFELMDKDYDGIDTILKLNHAKHSVLVTARSEELDIQERCLKNGIKLLPKSLVNYVKVLKGLPDSSLAQSESASMEGEDGFEGASVVLIDDDRLVHLNWSSYCKNQGLPFQGFKTIDDFLKVSETFDKTTRIYIDSNLGDGIKGEIESEKIFRLGFKNLYLATRYQKEYIVKPVWILDVYSKSPEILSIR